MSILTEFFPINRNLISTTSPTLIYHFMRSINNILNILKVIFSHAYNCFCQRFPTNFTFYALYTKIKRWDHQRDIAYLYTSFVVYFFSVIFVELFFLVTYTLSHILPFFLDCCSSNSILLIGVRSWTHVFLNILYPGRLAVQSYPLFLFLSHCFLFCCFSW